MFAVKKSILIIEDELPEQRALKEKFSREGFNTIVALNGEEGLSSALQNHPDLILLDLILPRMDGITVLNKLREDEWGKNVKVIILTDLSDADRIEEAMKKGVPDFLVKSDWKLSDVVKKVKEKLGES